MMAGQRSGTSLSGRRVRFILVQESKQNGLVISASFKQCAFIRKKNCNVFLTGFGRWYAKRFLHPDVVSAYEYIFIWDEDLGVEHFSADK